jgi:hypothetical protein
MSRAIVRSAIARARAAREVPVSVEAHMAQPCEGRGAAGRNQNHQLMRGGRA